MRICCDQNVAAKYVHAFEEADWTTVTTVTAELSHDAPDDEIVELAASEGWVVFTSDSDFFDHQRRFGLLVYSQVENPRPGEVVQAVRAIDRAYEEPADVVETVPGGWT